MEERKLRKTRVGVVVSDKANKTITVKVETYKKDPIYKKRINGTSRKFRTGKRFGYL